MKFKHFDIKIGIVIAILFILAMPIGASAEIYQFNQFFEGHGSVMLLINADTGAIVDANRSAVDYYGYTYDEMLSMKLQDINTITKNETNTELLVAVRDGKNNFVFDNKLASGEIRNVEIYSYPFAQDGKNLLYLIVHDITEKVVLQDALSARNRSMEIWGAIFLVLQSSVIILLWKSLRKNKRIQLELKKSKESYQSLFDNMGEGFALHEIITDKKGNPIDYRYIDVNDAFKELTGLKDVEGKTIMEILPGTESMWINKYGKVALTGETIRFESFVREIGKSYSVIAFSPSKGQFATIFIDISKRVEMESVLKAEKEKLMTILLSVGDGVIVTDVNGIVGFINDAAEEITGKKKEEVKGKSFKDLFKISDDNDNETEKCPVDDVLETGDAIDWAMNSCLNMDNGECVSITISAAPIVDSLGSIEGVVLIFRDNRKENKRREEIEFMSYHDFLTGLYNRRFFEEELARLDTKRNLPYSIIYADVNGLKIVNDNFGHEQGDRLLSETAKVLIKCCRADDIIARVGGDEFAILLPGTSHEMTKGLVERIREAIKTVKIPTGELSVALGWGTKTEESQNVSEILKLSENHMYKRKIEEKEKARNKI